LGEAGFTADKLEAKAQINLDVTSGKIDKSHITLIAKMPGISEEHFKACVKDADENCPVSKVLIAEITADANLE
jgi:osmotically inducible protein OsmC